VFSDGVIDSSRPEGAGAAAAGGGGGARHNRGLAAARAFIMSETSNIPTSRAISPASFSQSFENVGIVEESSSESSSFRNRSPPRATSSVSELRTRPASRSPPRSRHVMCVCVYVCVLYVYTYYTHTHTHYAHTHTEEP
jgi:hypothetical protein